MVKLVIFDPGAQMDLTLFTSTSPNYEYVMFIGLLFRVGRNFTLSE